MPQGSLLLPWVEPGTYVHPRGISISTPKAGQGVRLALQAARMYTPLPAAKATSTHSVWARPREPCGGRTHTDRPPYVSDLPPAAEAGLNADPVYRWENCSPQRRGDLWAKPTPQRHTLSQAPEVTQLVHSHLASKSICTLKKAGGQWGVVCICRRGQGKRRGHGSNSWGRLAEENGSSHVPAPMGCGC